MQGDGVLRRCTAYPFCAVNSLIGLSAGALQPPFPAACIAPIKPNFGPSELSAPFTHVQHSMLVSLWCSILSVSGDRSVGHGLSGVAQRTQNGPFCHCSGSDLAAFFYMSLSSPCLSQFGWMVGCVTGDSLVLRRGWRARLPHQLGQDARSQVRLIGASIPHRITRSAISFFLLELLSISRLLVRLWLPSLRMGKIQR